MRMRIRIAAVPPVLAICLLWGAAARAASAASDTSSAKPPAAGTAQPQGALSSLLANHDKKDSVKTAVDTTKAWPNRT